MNIGKIDRHEHDILGHAGSDRNHQSYLDGITLASSVSELLWAHKTSGCLDILAAVLESGASGCSSNLVLKSRNSNSATGANFPPSSVA